MRCSCLDGGQAQEARLGFREEVDGGVPGSPKRLFWKRAARAADGREQSGWRLRVMSRPPGGAWGHSWCVAAVHACRRHRAGSRRGRHPRGARPVEPGWTALPRLLRESAVTPSSQNKEPLEGTLKPECALCFRNAVHFGSGLWLMTNS